MVEFRSLSRDQWRELRNIRLRALSESPDTFLATHEAQSDLTEADWLAELDRGMWIVGTDDGVAISLVGITHDHSTHDDGTHDDSTHDDSVADSDRTKHFVEFMWVAPEHRKLGIAREMLDYAIDAHFRSAKAAEECRKARELNLWVLDGNWPAYWLYKRIGFASSRVIHPLEMRPGRTEELMTLDLSEYYVIIQQPSLIDVRR